jgi:hypothetical protein
VTNKIGHARYQVMAVFIGATVFLAAAATVQPGNFATSISLVFVGVALTGWNETICIANSTICVRDQREIGIGGGLAGSMRSGITAIIIAIYTTVLTNRLGETVPAQVPAAVLAAGLPPASVPGFMAGLAAGNATLLEAVPGISGDIIAAGAAAYKQASADAYRSVYFVIMGFGIFGSILTFWAPNTDKYMSDKIAATVHQENLSDDEKAAGMRS